MLKERTVIKGMVSWRVLDKYGDVKMFPKTTLQKLLGLPAQPMMGENHNVVTDEGDDMIADLMAETPGEVKVDGTNGHIEVGTGFTSEAKSTLSCATPTGSPELLDGTYPKTKGAFGAANGNVIQYVATFDPADLNDTGIDEAALLNNASAAGAECLAYAEISPAVNVTTADTLEVTWELTILGA
jgi:hypothetical protein